MLKLFYTILYLRKATMTQTIQTAAVNNLTWEQWLRVDVVKFREVFPELKYSELMAIPYLVNEGYLQNPETLAGHHQEFVKCANKINALVRNEDFALRLEGYKKEVKLALSAVKAPIINKVKVK